MAFRIFQHGIAAGAIFLLGAAFYSAFGIGSAAAQPQPGGNATRATIAVKDPKMPQRTYIFSTPRAM